MLPYIDLPFEFVAKQLGASVDELKLIFSFLASYPFAVVLKRLPDNQPWQKNAYIIAVALFYLVGLFDLWDGIWTLFLSSAGAYAIAYYIDGTFMPWIAFVFLMFHMSWNHIARQFTNDPTIVDITGAQMVLVMKLSGFCWNVHDGRLKSDLLTESQKKRAIYKMPTFLDYAGYVLFFPALFAGPAFEYNDYAKYINLSMFEVPKDAKAPPTRKDHRIPRSGTPAAWKAAFGLGWIFLFLQFSAWYSVAGVLSPQYMTYNLPRRIFILYMLGLTSRMKYYGVWTLTEGACILSGLGFNGIDPRTGKAKWDRLENVNPWNLETAQNSYDYLGNWNKNTNNWLKNYVYLRVTPKGKKPGARATFATFFTSAFWHGFYPGYYLTFLIGVPYNIVAKECRRLIRPFFLSPDGTKSTSYKVYYDIGSWFITQFAFCFCTAPFVILNFGDSITVWTRVYFYAIIGTGLSMAFFASSAKAQLRARLNARNHPHVPKSASQESLQHRQILGLPTDPGREIDEALDEIKHEVELRRRRGSVVTMPTGADLRRQIEAKLGRKMKVEKVVDGDGKQKIRVE